jgi:hypothetical protein
MEPDEPAQPPDGPASPPMPPDPFTGLREGATALHVLYTTLRAGGFTMTEGCIIIAVNIAVNAAMSQTPRAPEQS